MPKNPPDQRPHYRVDPNLDRYIPNHISSEERNGTVLLSLLLIAYGAYGLRADDLVVPTSRMGGIHLHGTAAWIMFGSLMAAVLNLLSIVADGRAHTL